MSVTILGGGIGGLAAGHYLLKAAKNNVLLVEKSGILGGWVRSKKDPHTGAILEQGPHTIRARGKLGMNTLSLVEELNLSKKVKAVNGDHPGAKNRLICVGNKLHFLPSNLSSMFKKMSPFSTPLIFAGYNFIFAPTKKCKDESIYSFSQRRFGKEIADYLISSMICGICAGNAKEISVNFLMSSLFEAEQKHGSIIKGLWKEQFSNTKQNESENYDSELCKRAKEEKWSVWTFDSGMKSLVDGLESSIKQKGGSIMLNSAITKIRAKENSVSCYIGDNEYQSSHVISALPAKILAPLLRDDHPVLADELALIPYVSVAVVNLVYSNNVLEHNAFGFLVPPSEKLPILGVIFHSCVFSQGDKTILTAMIGGSWFDEHLGKNPTEEKVLNTTLSQLKNILGISEKPDSYHISILRDCIPQYVVGHRDRVSRIQEYIKTKKLPLTLIGSSYNGVGVNDVIMSAKNVVQDVLK